jgi:P27 family predicted phage terminase small subunit
MPKVVSYDKMQVGKKGNGKHWTKTEVQKRAAAANKFKRKTEVKLKMPMWLDDLGRKVWKKTLKDMADFDILDNVDSECLSVYCDAVARHQELTLKIREEGYTIITAQGSQSVSPYVTAAQSYARIMMQYADKLGLNANARARLAKKKADNPADPNASMFGD